jgi:hypothetical protein
MPKTQLMSDGLGPGKSAVWMIWVLISTPLEISSMPIWLTSTPRVWGCTA